MSNLHGFTLAKAEEVSYCDLSCVINNYFKGHLLNYRLHFDQIGSNYSYMALFNNCSNGSGSLHI